MTSDELILLGRGKKFELHLSVMMVTQNGIIKEEVKSIKGKRLAKKRYIVTIKSVRK